MTKKRRGRWKHGQSGNPHGRPKGRKNKATAEVQLLHRQLVNDSAYRRTLLRRLRSGKLAPAVECLLWHYAYGKPKDTIQHEGGDVPLKFTLNLDVAKGGNGNGHGA